jgi:hypothetical protein
MLPYDSYRQFLSLVGAAGKFLPLLERATPGDAAILGPTIARESAVSLSCWSGGRRCCHNIIAIGSFSLC